METLVASIAYDELAPDSPLKALYHNPVLLQLVSAIVQKQLFLLKDPLGCCSINVLDPTIIIHSILMKVNFPRHSCCKKQTNQPK
jgi:hypothetical protein